MDYHPIHTQSAPLDRIQPLEQSNMPRNQSEEPPIQANFDNGSDCNPVDLDSELAIDSSDDGDDGTSSPARTRKCYSLPQTSVVETQIIVSALHHYAHWTYSELEQQFNIPLSTLHRIIHSTSLSQIDGYPGRGRQRKISDAVKQQLIETATANV
ncbi:hypothetical protein HOY82DRAFT_601801 [Tuber indicum]|nr:hypothetical protein HOY82DRAFT_601801 [Tuber indicum]